MSDYDKMIEAFWQGDKDTYWKLYNKLHNQQADLAERQGRTVTYRPLHGAGDLDEVVITAPRETEEQKEAKRKQEYENLVDAGITAAGFVSGLDTVSDVVDLGKSLYKGDYTGAAIGLAGAFLLGISAPMLRKGIQGTQNFFSNLPSKIKNYRAADKISSIMDNNVKDGIQVGQYYHGSPNRNITNFKTGKDGGIYWTRSKDAAKQYTGLFGQGEVYNADLNLGNKVVTINNNGQPWTKIPESEIAKAFNLSTEQVHNIIGSYNLGATPWHYGLTKIFGYKPKTNYYAIDQIVKLGKNQGISSLVVNNATDSGKRLFSRTMPYDQTIVYNSNQIILNKRQTPSLKQYGSYTIQEDGPLRLGYTTSGIKQVGTPTGNYHWREDITDINNPVLLDIKPDKHYTKNQTMPSTKEIVNADNVLQRIGIVPVSNSSLQDVEKITVNPTSRLIRVGQRRDLNLFPNRVVQFKQKSVLTDNKGRLVSSNGTRYFAVPTEVERQYTLWHKYGGKL